MGWEAHVTSPDPTLDKGRAPARSGVACPKKLPRQYLTCPSELVSAFHVHSYEWIVRIRMAGLTSLDSSLRKLVDSYWAQFFGCLPEALRSDTAQIVAHAGLGDYVGCYLMEFGGAPIVSLPVDELESSRAAIEQWHAGIVRFPALVEAIFGERVAARIGPAFVGYTDPKHFRLVSLNTTRQLTAQDEKAVNTLREACAVEEWEHGGSEFRPTAMAGVFKGHELAALASYQIWGEQIAHIAVVTHPAFRGQGYATTAVSGLTKTVLERSLIPQYRTLEGNAPSLAVARRLGFVQYATSLAFRFILPNSEGTKGQG